MDLLLFYNKLTFGDTYHAILYNWLDGHLPMVCSVTEYLQLCQDLDRRPSTILVIKHPDVGSSYNTLSIDYLFIYFIIYYIPFFALPPFLLLWHEL